LITELIISDIVLPPGAGDGEACVLAEKKLKGCIPSLKALSTSVYRCSVDARRKNNIRLVYSVLAECEGDLPDKDTLTALHAAVYSRPLPVNMLPDVSGMRERPVIVGMGPAGLFCALILAERGMRPIVLERGGEMRERIADRDRFYKTRVLDPDSNVQFGAGGAGTFSDGKLVTRVNDPRCVLVLELLAKLGAPKEILRKARPHVGTDLLPAIIENAAKRIVSLGGEIRYRTKMTGFDLKNGKVMAVKTDNGDIECCACVLATGHSARDVYAMLPDYGILREPKPFSVGVRIEHLTEDIDSSMYGTLSGHPALGHAEYSLSRRVDGRGVYTFCMCPGGEVVCGSTENGGVVTNGMSCFARDGRNSNSAVAVSVEPADVGGTPEAAVEFQRMLERKAFELGGGCFSAPVSTVGDLLRGTYGSKPTVVKPTYMGGDNYRLADLSRLFPGYICNSLRGGITAFGRVLRGFDADHAILTGAETRTSAPMRILRNEELTAPGFINLYPCGEGAGYAGGITSAAVDGIKVAEKIIFGAVSK